jgi:hypothetical protein
MGPRQASQFKGKTNVVAWEELRGKRKGGRERKAQEFWVHLDGSPRFFFLAENNKKEADWGLEGNWGVEIALIMRERL